jgi:arginyl-tRNA synthetase
VAEVSANDVIDKLDVAGPGFVNIFVSRAFVENQVRETVTPRLATQSRRSETFSRQIL